jgi:hypothetical protein
MCRHLVVLIYFQFWRDILFNDEDFATQCVHRLHEGVRALNFKDLDHRVAFAKVLVAGVPGSRRPALVIIVLP